MSIFDMESPFQRFLNRMTDLLILNLITLLACLPVVTAGASLTAMHYVLLKMVRGQEGYVVRSFWRSFRQNFVQATVIWVVMLFYGLFAGSNLFAMLTGPAGGTPVWIPVLLAASVILEYLLMLYVFPLLSRYENPVKDTLLNAMMLVFGRLPLTAEMAVIMAVPAAMALWVTPLLPLAALFGLSVPGYACAMLYSPLFSQIEGEESMKEEHGEPGTEE